MRFVSIFLASLVILVILAFVLGQRWNSSVPSRPSGVPEEAAFLRYPYTGFPGPPRGRWMFCWQTNGHDRCKIVSVQGETLFEGDFLLAHGDVTIPSRELTIDPDRTSDEQSLWTGRVHVPLAKLRNGKILIPAFAYDEGKKILDRTETPAAVPR